MEWQSSFLHKPLCLFVHDLDHDLLADDGRCLTVQSKTKRLRMGQNHLDVVLILVLARKVVAAIPVQRSTVALPIPQKTIDFGINATASKGCQDGRGQVLVFSCVRHA